MRFTKLLTNGFRNSFKIPKVCYELGIFITWLSLRNEVVNISSAKLRSSSRVKFASSVGYMTTNEFKQIERNAQPAGKAYFMMFTSEM